MLTVVELVENLSKMKLKLHEAQLFTTDGHRTKFVSLEFVVFNWEVNVVRYDTLEKYGSLSSRWGKLDAKAATTKQLH